MNSFTGDLARSGAPPIAARVWPVRVGHLVRGLVIAFLALDAVMKLLVLEPVVEAMNGLGWPSDPTTVRALGAALLAVAILYALRPTSLLGAILLTAYLGGAVATHARIGSPFLTHTAFGIYVGLLAWLGLWLVEPRLRAILAGDGRGR